MSVTKNMTHIWIGPRKAPTKWMQTWQEKHPDWNYRVLDNNEFHQRTWRLEAHMQEYYKRKLYNGVADMIRYEVLLEEGGFLPPADSVCLHPIDELLTDPPNYCYSVYENEKIKPGYVSPIQAANLGNDFVALLIDAIAAREPESLTNKPWEDTGNAFLMRMIERHNPDITIWPSHYLIPKHFSDAHTRYNGPDKVYADQMWGSTKACY